MKFSISMNFSFLNLLLVLLFGIGNSTSLSAQTAQHSQRTKQKIEAAFKELENDPALRNGILSLTIMDGNSGTVIFSKNEQIGLATASTLKLITTATAYSVLGADFTYKTDLFYDGEIDNTGTLHGNIIIKGAGDPTLGSDRFEKSKADNVLNRWVKAIQAKGIKKIEGSIIGDDLLFNGQQLPGGWTWNDMGNYYGAGVSALNWRENAFYVVLNAGVNVGDPVKLLTTEPVVPYLTIVNEVTTGKPGSGDQVYAYSAPYSSIISLRGTYGMDLNKKIGLSLPDPAYAVALNLKQGLEGEGVAVSQPSSTSFLINSSGIEPPPLTNLLDRYESPNLKEINHWFNTVSINLYGEAILKTVGLSVNEETSTQNMAAWEGKYWEKKLGIPFGELRIKDGSGLSPETRVTTNSMVKILNDAKVQPWFGNFYDNIPVFNDMKMKSGTISGVLGYAGYHTASDGTPFVFSILINNYQGSATSMRQKMFKVLNSMK